MEEKIGIIKERFQNTEVEQLSVLIEESDNNYSYGHTSNYIHVKINGIYDKGQLLNVKIVDIDYPYCIGKSEK